MIMREERWCEQSSAQQSCNQLGLRQGSSNHWRFVGFNGFWIRLLIFATWLYSYCLSLSMQSYIVRVYIISMLQLIYSHELIFMAISLTKLLMISIIFLVFNHSKGHFYISCCLQLPERVLSSISVNSYMVLSIVIVLINHNILWKTRQVAFLFTK